MSLSLQGRLRVLLSYIVFAGALGWTALMLGSALVRESLAQLPLLAVMQPAEPSRVARFLSAEIEARKAPRVPVPRVLVAREPPPVSAPALAVHLDRAESLAAEPIKVTRRPVQKVAAMEPRRRLIPGKLSETALADALSGAALPVAKKKPARQSRAFAQAETARDITHRNLGIVAVAIN